MVTRSLCLDQRRAAAPELIEADPALEPFFRTPAPIAYERASPEDPFLAFEPRDPM